MAELVGLIASSIAIVETAGKVTGAVLALKKLWDEVQDVPDIVRNLMTEIEVLEPILTVIEDDFEATGSPLPNDRASQLALAYCRKAVTDLDDLVQNLSVDLQAARRSKRGRAKVRVILEKQTLKRLQSRMQAALRLLTLAQQTYLVALTKSQPEIIFRRFESTPVISLQKTTELPNKDNNEGIALREDVNVSTIESRQFDTRASFPCIANWRTAFGNVAWGHGKKDSNTIFGWMTRIEAPGWLSQKAWDLRVVQSTYGWQMNLKAYCVRPDEHQAFEHVKHGDTQALDALIRSGQASLYDINEDGRSFLHIAFLFSQVEMAQQLLLWGADITLADRTYFFATPAHAAIEAVTYGDDQDFLAWPKMDCLLKSIGAYEDIDDLDPWKPGSRRGAKGDDEDNEMSSSVKYFDFFQPIFSPNHYELDICERLDYGRVHWSYNDDVLRYLLFDEGTVTSEQIQALEKGGIGPLNLVAYGYNHSGHRSIDPRLRALARDLIQLGADLHFGQHPQNLPPHMRGMRGYPFSTPFFGVLIPEACYNYNYIKSPGGLQKRIKKTMLFWLNDLQICGIDLCRYGKVEQRVYRRNEILKQRWYPWNRWMRLTGFKYGPKPEDWVLEWDLFAEEFAGEFWIMVADQLQYPSMPGAWVDASPTHPMYVGYYDDSESSEISDSNTK